jgi:hypothetical protein
MSTIPEPTLRSPFSHDARQAWWIRICSPGNTNRSRPTPERAIILQQILLGIYNEEGDAARRLRYETWSKYELVGSVLKIKRKNSISKTVVTDLEVFDLIVNAHLTLGHAGSRKTYEELDRDCYRISRQEVEWLLKHCTTCAMEKSQSKTAPIKAVIVNKLFERLQVDLIDMSATPDGDYRWICHIRDHFSKDSQAYGIVSKHSEKVAAVFKIWVSHLGPPKILQCDNGSEFKGALLELLRTVGVQV